MVKTYAQVCFEAEMPTMAQQKYFDFYFQEIKHIFSQYKWLLFLQFPNEIWESSSLWYSLCSINFLWSSYLYLFDFPSNMFWCKGTKILGWPTYLFCSDVLLWLKNICKFGWLATVVVPEECSWGNDNFFITITTLSS